MKHAAHPDRSTLTARNRLSLALEAAGVVGIWDGDLINDRIYADESFARIYGVDAVEAARGRPLGFYFKYIHPDDLASSNDAIARMKAGMDEYANEHRIVRPDGSVRWVLARGRLARDASGRPVRFHGVSIDLTERKQAEDRQAFVLRLSDELRNLGDPERVLAIATARLGEYLGAARAGYGEIQSDHATVTVTCGYAKDAESINGSFRLEDFGPRLAASAELGMSLVIDDALAEPGLQLPTWRSFGTRAHVSVPLIRDGRYRALLYVTHTLPHHWTDDEVRLIEEVAERIWDALERARAERALHLANEELKTLVAVRTADRNRIWQLADEVMVICDESGRFIEVNPAASRLLGLSEHELKGKRLADFLHPDDVGRTTAEIQRLLTGRSSMAFENRYRTQSGAYRLISWMATYDGGLLHGVGRDITDEHAARLERERLWSATNDLMGTASFDGYMVSVNPAWTRMLGFSESELTSRPYMDIIDPQDHDRCIDIVCRMRDGERMHNFESRMLHKDGHRFVILWTGERFGDLMYIVGRDITAQRAAEEKLRQSQKMEAVGQLTGGIAHDFNNMLQGIRAAVEVMSHRLAQGRFDDTQRYISIAEQSIDRAATLTHRLLAFSRRQALAPQTVELGGLLHGIGKLIQQTVGPMIDFQLRLIDACWPVRCDPNQLENAVLNLAINARDAMLPQGGGLVIETAHTVLGTLEVAGCQDALPGEFVCLSVKDTGSGMTTEVLQRAFEPFFTTKSDGQGTGLGLSQVYGFVSQSGGFMKLDSAVGAGTTVRIYLPRHVGAAVSMPAREDSGLPQRIEPRPATVLLVEDEADIRSLTAHMLRDRGHIVIEAQDGGTALSAMQGYLTTGEHIDLLIADIGLPGGMNGRQLANAVRQRLPDLPVVLITGYAGQALGPGSEVSEGISLLSKPFSLEIMVARAEELIAAGSQPSPSSVAG
jgi:PAS domain S-box-containing protein